MASIPSSCSVLVIGGGPGGSYAAAALAREGVDVVLLEADVFPRYHIGESMVASMRPFLRFIDLDSTFDGYGFEKKLGAFFKFNDKKASYTDFIASNGPKGYAWNVIRSESDHLMLQHAAKCGAHVFEGVRVNALEFVELDFPKDRKLANHGRPVSATWSLRNETSGSIKFEYIIDASGRAGLLSTKYLKNRKFNEGLKNTANWGYWKGAKRYAAGTSRENQPFFEALTDASGWCWTIPLHDGTLSVGVVMRQDAFQIRREMSGSENRRDIYLECVYLAPQVKELLSDAQLVSDVKFAADWSYSAKEYAGPYFRIVGDAGCFIDPLFSSGVHLAVSSALSAVITIQSARKNECDEFDAAKWHSNKVAEGYTRFLLLVMTTMKQIRRKNDPVLADIDEENFDTAIKSFRPIIQGTADADIRNEFTQEEVSQTIEFCMKAFEDIDPVSYRAFLDRVKGSNGGEAPNLEILSEEDRRILSVVYARGALDLGVRRDVEKFSKDVVNGFLPNVQRGSLGLRRAENIDKTERYQLSALLEKVSVEGF